MKSLKLSVDARSFLVLTAFALFLLRDVLFFGRAFFERDLAWTYLPAVEAFVRSVAEGALPTRDTSIGFGQPLLATPDSGVLYPPTWFHLFFLPDRAYSFMVLFHLIVGATGAAKLAGRLAGKSEASIVAGALFLLSGPFQSMVNLWHHLAGAAWIPWVLQAFEDLLESTDARRALRLAGLFGLQILAGSADMCAMTLALAAVRLLCEGRRLKSNLGGRAAWITTAVVLGVLIGAVTWLPATEIVRNSRRSALTREARTEWSVHPLAAAETVLPLRLGALPLNAETSTLLNDGRPPFINTLFLGALTLPLCASGALSAAVALRKRVWLLLGIGLMGMGALGKFSFAYDLMVALMPPLAIFRYPSKAMVPIALLASVLASLGLRAMDGLARRVLIAASGLVLIVNLGLYLGAGRIFAPLVAGSPSATSAIESLGPGFVGSAVALGLLAAAAFTRRVSLAHAALLAALAVGVHAGRDVNITVAREVLRFRPDHARLLKDEVPTRLYVPPYLLRRELLPEIFGAGAPPQPEMFMLLTRSAVLAPIGGAWGLEYGFDLDQRGLLDWSLAGLTRYMNSGPTQAHFVRLLQMGNVTRVADFRQRSEPELSLERTIEIPGLRPLNVYRVQEALPRAYAVSGARVAPVADARTLVLDPAFDPHREVILNEGEVAIPVSPDFKSVTRIVSRRPDGIEVDATLSGAGHVVLVEGFLPGWTATVDGTKVPVLRANALFVAVKASQGAHRIVFTYRPTIALVGIGLTVTSALALGLALAWLAAQPRAVAAQSPDIATP